MKRENRETVEMWMTENEFLEIARIAHEKDITFNDAVVMLLEEHMERTKKDAQS
jgi:hypothetical protein